MTKKPTKRTPRKHPGKTDWNIRPGAPRLETLITKEAIAAKVRELARRITADYSDKNLSVLVIASGALIFASDLVRGVGLPMRIDCVSMGSYSGTRSTGRVRIFSDLKIDISGQDVLVVEDIVDSGKTMSALKKHLRKFKPADVRICSLLDKPSRREVPMNCDYTGFTIPDLFVVGYGMDFNGYFRNLPHIAFMRQPGSGRLKPVRA